MAEQQTTGGTTEAFFRFKERIVSKRHSVERVRGWLRAINAFDSVPYDPKHYPVEAALMDDFTRNFFMYCPGINPWSSDGSNTIAWNLAVYPDYRRQIRDTICDIYDICPVPELGFHREDFNRG